MNKCETCRFCMSPEDFQSSANAPLCSYFGTLLRKQTTDCGEHQPREEQEARE